MRTFEIRLLKKSFEELLNKANVDDQRGTMSSMDDNMDFIFKQEWC